MKKLTLVAGQGDLGGGEQMLLRMGEAAIELGWDVQVLGPAWGELAPACDASGLQYEAAPGKNRRSYTVSASSKLALPGRGVVWANGALPALAASATPNRLVVHLHQQPSKAQSWAIKAALARAKAVVVPSTSMARSVPGSRAMLNWTSPPPLLQRAANSGTLTVAYVGRLSWDKGVDTLAAAVDRLVRQRRIPDARLLVAGDERFVPRQSYERVRVALDRCSAEVVRLGWVDSTQVMSRADVVVVPSRWPEPFGLVAAEAMAAGCPLLVSDSGALPEVVGENYEGIFPAGSVKELSDRLERVHWQPPVVEVARLRRRWEKYFTPAAGRQRLNVILEGVNPPSMVGWGGIRDDRP